MKAVTSSQVSPQTPSPLGQVARRLPYARWRSTYMKQRAIFEVGISPIATVRAHALLKAMLLLLAQTVDGEQRHGAAPKTVVAEAGTGVDGLGALTSRDD